MEPWKEFFGNMTFPYGFYDPEEYKAFLREAGLVPERVELFPKDMKFNDAEGLAGWIRTTWLPFTEKLPVELRAKFVEVIVNRYLEEHPADGCWHGSCWNDAHRSRSIQAVSESLKDKLHLLNCKFNRQRRKRHAHFPNRSRNERPTK